MSKGKNTIALDMTVKQVLENMSIPLESILEIVIKTRYYVKKTKNYSYSKSATIEIIPESKESNNKEID